MTLFSIFHFFSSSRLLKACLFASILHPAKESGVFAQNIPRQRILINDGWKFYRYEPGAKVDSLIYDARPDVNANTEVKPADARPTEAVAVSGYSMALKPWILPAGNRFIRDNKNRYKRPEGNPGSNFPFVRKDFNDISWENVNLPHDWAIKGPFYKGANTPIGGGMGRLPVQGVAWYRKKINIPSSDQGKSFFLDIDGAMSYASVWVNGTLAGGWPYGYTSWRLDLTPYIKPGEENQLAIRLDNPPASSRWYPGGGIYRNVWLVKTNPVHVSQWGTRLTTRNVSARSADIDLEIVVDNDSEISRKISVTTDIFLLNEKGQKPYKPVARFKPTGATVGSRESESLNQSLSISNPSLWGTPPSQTPHLYVAVTGVFCDGKKVDSYETQFGIRDIRFDPNKGLFLNGEHIVIKGVNQHHDLGSLGAAFNLRAAQRQLEVLKEMGCNAVRMAHNPPAPELLELTDKMGFLVIDEIFDSWELKKTPLDFHLIFPDWHEQDLRAMIRRDRNHPSIVIWSFGNEVGEQYNGKTGRKVAERLYSIAKEEDDTRPLTCAMNYAKPDMPLPDVVDVISLNYQGEGIRWDGPYAGLKGISTPPQFEAFHTKFPEKVILSTENASTFSSRGEYLFPVYKGNSAPVKEGFGGNSAKRQISAYELYSVEFGSSPDKVFATTDQHPFVAGGFVWTGWDYLGEPTPYYSARSSYSGIIDLAGFKKDRFYLYQSYWRPDFPMAHILPHWTWPDRNGQITPVHVFTSGDEAELFLNGQSLGRKMKAPYEYRLRWDSVKYSPGELKVVVYKKGKKWAEDSVRTAGQAYKLTITADNSNICADGKDLSFVTVRVEDKDGLIVPQAENNITFSVDGTGELAATDNGDAANLVSFASPVRQAFHGLCLAVIRSMPGKEGVIKITAKSEGMKSASIFLKSSSKSN